MYVVVVDVVVVVEVPEGVSDGGGGGGGGGAPTHVRRGHGPQLLSHHHQPLPHSRNRLQRGKSSLLVRTAL